VRAFILKKPGNEPSVGNFSEPRSDKDHQVAEVIMAALNPYDRATLNNPAGVIPRAIGSEAVVRLKNGKLAYAESTSPYGAIAEKTLVRNQSIILLPKAVSPEQALLGGISGLAGWLPLAWQAKLKPKESVLILGATGIQGQIAVQAARLMKAGHITAAGRDQKTLNSLKSRGADSIAVFNSDIVATLKKAAPAGGYDVVIDSLFGTPIEALLKSGTLHSGSRVISLGSSAGSEINLNISDLFSIKGASLSAYSTFYVPATIKKQAYLDLIKHIHAGDIEVPTKVFPLKEASAAWKLQAIGPHQKILVRPSYIILLCLV